MFDGSSQCTIVLPVEYLGYGLVVPFLAYRTGAQNSAKVRQPYEPAAAPPSLCRLGQRWTSRESGQGGQGRTGRRDAR
eukprot:scaffold12448_cov69-Phaeocystis_antarctica.AAC.1